MNRRTARIVIAVVVVVALAAGAWYLFVGRKAQEAAGKVVVSGTIDADQVQVSSLVGGRISSADIEEGEVVGKGDTLYKIDDRALKAQLDQAKAAVKATKVAYDEAKDNGDSDAEVAAAKAAWQQAKAAEKIAKIQLGYAKVSAPATGTVTSIALRKGELASSGRTLATLTLADSLFVRTFVPEPRIGDVALRDAATIETDSGDTVDATVTFIASEAQFTPSSVETQDQRAKLVYEVRLVPSSPDKLTPGMPVTVTIGK
jgi:HlyD family secretion protein